MKPLADLLDPATTAIVVVDVQNDFCHPEGVCAQGGADVSTALEMIPRLQLLLDGARRCGARVVFVQKVHEDCTDSESWLARSDGRPGKTCRRGTWGAEFMGVAPLPGEAVVNSHRYSAFINTRLDTVLRTYGIETLVMTGCATNVCVESTARQGYMLDYHIVFTSDATAAYEQDAHEMTLQNMRKHFGVVASVADVLSVWEQAGILAPALAR